MSECDLKIEIRQMVKNSHNANIKAVGSIVRALQMRHSNLDICFATKIANLVIKEPLCVDSKHQ